MPQSTSAGAPVTPLRFAPVVGPRTAEQAIALFDAQRALVKTVKNTDWLGLLWQLAQ